MPAAEHLPMTPAISPMQPCPLNEVLPCVASSDSQRASTPEARGSPKLAQMTCPKVTKPLVSRPKSLEPPSEMGPPISQLTNHNVAHVESQEWPSETILNREPPKGSPLMGIKPLDQVTVPPILKCMNVHTPRESPVKKRDSFAQVRQGWT